MEREVLFIMHFDSSGWVIDVAVGASVCFPGSWMITMPMINRKYGNSWSGDREKDE